MQATILTIAWDIKALANSVNPDQTPHSAASDQGYTVCYSLSSFKTFIYSVVYNDSVSEQRRP